MKEVRRAVVVALLLSASCSQEISANNARQSADEFVAREYGLTDFRLVKVETSETPTKWVVTYSAKGEIIGGRSSLASIKRPAALT